MKYSFIICAAVLLSAGCNNEAKNAESKTDSLSDSTSTSAATTAAPAAMPDTAAMMKAWNDFKTPGKMHQWLSSSVGTWDSELSQWMSPTDPPMKSKATTTITMGFKGLYQFSKFTGSMMGQPFEGQSTLGYDNAKKMFVNSWIDNSGSGIVYMTGNYDEATKTLNLKGKQTDPVTGKDSDIREELTVIDDDTQRMAMYGTGMDGKEMKFMEGVFKRRK
ncbi:MAG TPA: DUF1579 domain-containing protein [Chitinophagaceae bacterium]|nr:DUF1579 domain-containing protein [Chitinophagaceae bacterium]